MTGWIDTFRRLYDDMNIYSMRFDELKSFLPIKKYIFIFGLFSVLFYFSQGWVFYILLFMFVIYLLVLGVWIHAVKHFWVLYLDEHDEFNGNKEYILLALKYVGEDVLDVVSEDLLNDTEFKKLSRK